MAKKLATVIY